MKQHGGEAEMRGTTAHAPSCPVEATNADERVNEFRQSPVRKAMPRRRDSSCIADVVQRPRPQTVPMLTVTPSGLYCPPADFYIDPWQPVDRAVITHAHGDHARWGSRHYLASREGGRVLRTRLGPDASIELVDYGEPRTINGVRVSLHPAGHILGSAQVRVEHRGEVWVVSGDYKTEPDPTCTPFEPVRCHTFITESTFGLPIYRWCAQAETFADIRAWWRDNASDGRASLVFALRARQGAAPARRVLGAGHRARSTRTARSSG